jgi:L-ascorbate metabolism protein UlaG (beta-lactamase superfamily)
VKISDGVRLVPVDKQAARVRPTRSLPLLFALVAVGGCRDEAPGAGSEIAAVSQAVTASADGPAFVDITWMSISNVYYQLGSLKILTDGYVTRIPATEFFGGGGGLAHTHDAFKPDAPLVARVRDALGGATAVNLLLTGHSHFDHSFDTATWSSMTGAPILGSKTTCYQILAQNLPAERCTPIFGGEKMALSGGVTMRVVRWNHSGDPSSNPEQHNPVELQAVPIPDPTTGGLHAGVAEDFPNGGGARGFLFTVDGPQGPFSWFYQNTASPTDLTVPIVLDGVNYGAPLDNLRAAMSDAGLTSVDLWIGTGGKSIAQLVLPIIHPKAYLPVHWDGLSGAFLAGTPSAFSDSSLESYLTQSSVKLVRPRQYMDKWRLDVSGVVAVDNTAVKQALGFSPQSLWREAESAGLTPPMQIASDTGAVGGKYITVAPGNNSMTAAPTTGRATFPFTLAAAGTFKIWGRVIAPTTSDDSFWLIVDGGVPIMWNDITPGSTWHWAAARDSGHSNQLVQLGLAAGDHTLQIAYREDGAKLDRLLITSDSTLTPSGAGAPAPQPQ